MITKIDFDAKLLSLNKKLLKIRQKRVLFESELDKLKTFDSGYFIGKSHFEENGTQTYSVFQPIYRYFIVFSITQYLEYGLGLSSESFKASSTCDNSLNPTLNYYGTKIRIKFTGDCLNQQKITYNQGKVVNIYIVYSFGVSSSTYNKILFL